MTKRVWFIVCLALIGLSGCMKDTPTKQEKVSLPTHSLGVVKPVTSCQQLQSVDLSSIGGMGSQITQTQLIRNHQGHTVCEVSGQLAPTIGFKVQLPTQNWTQRYMQLGCGGLCGRVNLMVGAAEQCPTINNSEFVLASTDMGHQGNSSDFGYDPQKRIDFAYRSVHITSIAAKAIIQAYYGQAAKYAYFNGCSDGGREALMEAQRFPDDFDGIIAGAPAMNFSVQNSMHHGWLARSNQDDQGHAILHANDMPILHQAVLEQCDALDGLKDGLINDPRACHFDPSTTLCKPGQTTACLTAQQVDAANKIYQGPHDEKTGIALALGAPMPGSELAWPGVFVPQAGGDDIFSVQIAESALQTLVFEHNPRHFELSQLKFDIATFDKLRPLYGLYSAVDPDLSAFKHHGGKLILWHGWSDPHISPINSIAYYQAVQNTMGKASQDSFMKFYLIPGMYHCFGGDGPSAFDLVTPMLNWVEQGSAPNQVLSQQYNHSQLNGAGAPVEKKDRMPSSTRENENLQVVRSRPLYPYPQTAIYKGEGDPNLASSFTSKLDTQVTDTTWAGSNFYQPNQQLNCQAEKQQLKCVQRQSH